MASLLSTPVEKLLFADIEQFCDEGHRESSWLDYKRAFPKSDSEHDAIAKIVSAMANAQGGICLLGVSEIRDKKSGVGIPDEIVGIPVDLQAENRIKNICLDKLSPPVVPEIFGYKLDSDPSLEVVLIRIAASDILPHEIVGSGRVYVRTNDVSHLADDGKQAGPRQIQWMLNRRERAVAFKENLIARAEQRAQKAYIHGPVFSVGVLPLYPSIRANRLV